MEKIVIQDKIYENKFIGYRPKTIYVTRDKMEFEKEKDAKSHEEYLDYLDKLHKVKTVNFSDFEFMPMSEWCYLDSEETLDFIFNNLTKDSYCTYYLNGYIISRGNPRKRGIVVGDWITSIYDSSGDGRPTNNLYTLRFVREEIIKFLKGVDV